MKTRMLIVTCLAAFFTLIFAAAPAEAQRRSFKNERLKQKNEQKEGSKSVKENTSQKNKKVNSRIQRSSTGTRRTVTQDKRSSSVAKPSSASVNNRGRSATRESKLNKVHPTKVKAGPAPAERRNPGTNRSNLNISSSPNQRESFRSNGSVRNGSTYRKTVSKRGRTEHNRMLYKIDAKDSRYSPTKYYKGNKTRWDAGYAKHYIHYTKHNENYYRNYNYRKHLHWDHHWETYTWNIKSWRDYYNGYHPYSYSFHKHYFYHPGYGHVIRRFGKKPEYFVHNNVRYYNYNGHFFRRFPGVGYVLVDMPYGWVFEKLPGFAEAVYINGFLYFRVGNLFFEKNSQGYALIHYPERYYALNAEFYNGGYYRAIEFNSYR